MELLLQKIGKIIGLDLSYFFRNGKWIFIRYVAVSASGLALTVVFTRFAEKETFGHYQFALAIISMLSIFSLPGLNTASMREATSGNFGGVKKSVYLSTLLSFFITIFGALFGIWMVLKGETASGFSIMAAAIIAPFFYGPNNWYVFYESKLDFRSTTIRIIFSSIVVSLVTALIVILGGGAVWIIVTYLGMQAIFGWTYFYEAAKNISGQARGAALDLKYGIACTVQKFTNTTMNENLPTLVITASYGFQNLAVFQIAYFCFASISGLFGAFASTYLPLLFKYQEIEVRRAIFQNLALGVGFALVYFFAVWILFLPIFGIAYQSSFSLALVFSAFIPLIPVKIFLSSYFSSRNKNGFISVTYALSGLVSGFLLWIFRDTTIFFAVVLSFGAMYAIQVGFPLGHYFLWGSSDSRKTASI